MPDDLEREPSLRARRRSMLWASGLLFKRPTVHGGCHDDIPQPPIVPSEGSSTASVIIDRSGERPEISYVANGDTGRNDADMNGRRWERYGTKTATIHPGNTTKEL